MSPVSVLGGSIESLEGPPPHMAVRWDPETEILSALAEVEAGRGMTGSIELEDAAGAVVTLDFAGGVFRGLEIVVWPRATTVPGLAAPAADRAGRLVVPFRPSQPGVAVLEVDVALTVDRAPDESVLRLGVGSGPAVERVALADNFLIELDASGELAGFWLTQVPAFPGSEGE